jgi:hypothetical protein
VSRKKTLFFTDGIQKLVKCWQKCFVVRGDYVGNDYAQLYVKVNPLALSDPYMGPNAQLTSRPCILNTYSTNIRTEYSKHAA